MNASERYITYWYESAAGDVEELEITNRSVKGVRTSDDSFGFDYVIVTAGPWTKPLLQTVGINVPVNPQKGFETKFRLSAFLKTCKDEIS